MEVAVSEAKLEEAGADLAVVGLREGDSLPAALEQAAGAGDARGGFGRLALLHPTAPARLLVIGLGEAERLDAERLRVAAALAAGEARRLEARSLAWVLPTGPAEKEVVAALVTGTILGSYRFDRFRSDDPDEPPPTELEALTLLCGDSAPAAAGGGRAERLAAAAWEARAAAEAANRARDLQSLPANVATPTFLAERAAEIAAASDALEVEVLGRERLAELGMGGLLAVSAGGPQEPQMIVLRYHGGGSGPTLGLVGKGVTFDTGGISLKPGAGMHEMKYDMSGAAAVLEATGAIAEMGLALEIVTVVAATENMPSGTAVKPGDVITQYNGKTVEVNNTDAEGRLILADALSYAVDLGAERLVDLATLTGAVTIALGSTYAAVIANDDELCTAVEQAGGRSGELVWRLPLHPEFKALMKGKVADLSNLASKRKAGTITAASFLEEFVSGTPWAHVDIAGTAWDVGREYTGSEASGFGVRLLVALAGGLASPDDPHR